MNVRSLSISGNRKQIRKKVISAFLDEEPGTGTGPHSSKYRYDVETLKNGDKVFLKRPAALNKGVDFEVHVEGISFRDRGGRKTMPSHKNIVDDLIAKNQEKPRVYSKVKKIINKIYECKRVSEREYRSLSFRTGHSIEAILKAIKWLFIEQDVTYWNWSGRSMLFSGLQNNDLC